MTTISYVCATCFLTYLLSCLTLIPPHAPSVYNFSIVMYHELVRTLSDPACTFLAFISLLFSVHIQAAFQSPLHVLLASVSCLEPPSLFFLL